MPDLRLLTRNGKIVEKLPGRCLFCGARIKKLRVRTATVGSAEYRLPLPICDEDRSEGDVTIEHRHGQGGEWMARNCWRIPILYIFWGFFKLSCWLTTSKESRSERIVTIHGVCFEFLDALDGRDEGKRTEGPADEFEELSTASGRRASRRRLRQLEGPGPLPWILAGIGTFLFFFLLIGGTLYFRNRDQRAQEKKWAELNKNPPREPVQPPPAPPAPAAPVRQVQATPGEILPALEGHSNNVISLACAPRGNALMAADEDGCVWRWQTNESQPPQHTWKQIVRSKLYGVAISPDGELAAATAWDGHVQLLAGVGGEPLDTLQDRIRGIAAYDLAFSADSKTLLTGHKNYDIKVWDLDTRKLRTTLKGGNELTTAIAFSPDGKLFASAGGFPDDSITLWDAEKQQPIGTLKGHDTHGAGGIYRLTFSPDSKMLASAAWDGTARLWDVAGQQARSVLTHPQKWVNAVVFTPDGSVVITGCKDGQIRFRDAATGQQRSALDTHQPSFAPGITALAVSPDGKWMAAACSATFRRWSLPTVLAGIK